MQRHVVVTLLRGGRGERRRKEQDEGGGAHGGKTCAEQKPQAQAHRRGASGAHRGNTGCCKRAHTPVRRAALFAASLSRRSAPEASACTLVALFRTERAAALPRGVGQTAIRSAKRERARVRHNVIDPIDPIFLTSVRRCRRS